MSSQSKFYTKKNIDPKESISSITAVNISDKHLITGDEQGNLIVYEFGEKGLIVCKKSTPGSKTRIDKIVTHHSRKIAFVLVGGEVYYVKLPLMQVVQSLFKTKDTINIFLNRDDIGSENMILVLNKKKKLKLYELNITSDKVICIEKKLFKEITLEDFPKCAIWTARNYFVYSINLEDGKNCSSNWINLDKDILKSDKFPGSVEISDLGEKVAVTNGNYTFFMRDGSSFQINPLSHLESDFRAFCEFKNHLVVLYGKSIGIFKEGQQKYNIVETIPLDEGDIGKFIVASKYKLAVVTESGKKIHVIEFQERPYEDQIKILIDEKQYDKGLEKLIENIDPDDPNRQQKVEDVFLDCAWGCLEGDKKDFDNSIKYISLTNFNPFEFMYMFFESLYVDIIHTDKATEIKDRKKENQFFGLSAGEEEQNDAYKYLIQILKLKRDYILEKIVKPDKSAEIETKKITFSSSKRSKINLSDSKIEITIRDTFYAINSTLIKSMIKIKADPKEIESVLDNETINNSKFDDFDKDEFFKEEKNKNLDEAKFTLSYILEKKGNNFQKALEQWESFGRSNNKKYSLIAKDRTKKIFFKFKESKDTEKEEKEKLFRKYIQWLLEKYQNEAFEVVTKTEIVSNKIFLEEIIPEFNKNRTDGKTDDLKEKFLEYCNENQRTENYQTQLLQLYADKLFTLAGHEHRPEKLEGEVQRYYDSFMKIVKSQDSVFNKKVILDYIDKSWLFKPRIYLYSQLKEYDLAMKDLFKQSKRDQSFKDLEEFCQANVSSHHEIFQELYKLLSKEVQDCQDGIDKNLEQIKEIKDKLSKESQSLLEEEKKNYEKQIKDLEDGVKTYEASKEPFEKEMFNILKNHGKIDELNPIKALEFANDHWNVCESNEFFDYLMNVVKEYTLHGNKYKIAKNFSEIGLIYKEKEAYDYKKKNVTIDSDKACDLCKKKIGPTLFVVYPNLKVYHAKCAPNANIDPMTGVDFSKKKYVE